MDIKVNYFVKLNEKGVDCYNRNKNCKKIPIGEIIKVIDFYGWDNQRAIWKVRDSKNNIDHYWVECLIVVN